MALRVENLRIYYRTLHGYVHAVEGATFSVRDGEIMGLAGESGCGKTTLGHSLVYMKPPMIYMEGKVFLDGQELPIWDMRRMNEFRWRLVSIIPQYAMNALNPTRRIGHLIADLLAERGLSYKHVLPELKRRLDLVQLSPEVLDRYPFELSGGMRQRMVMVISTLLNPSLLIADEITSALDVSTQKAVCEMIIEFRNRGFVRSTIFITHDMSILYQIADTVLVMYAGQLVEKAPVEEIFRSPRHPYTRMLIAALPRVGARQRTERLRGIPGSPPRLLDPPPGCRFRDRCPVAFERCTETPPFVEVEPGHFVACWREI